ncbi:MAG: hypothetical protein M1158_04285 [Candidatus Marsarchaeota archaeon]|jgi:hypothetical protein|nr:hypothetical protein [Candidatus Marsarchaeota archaeon]
MAKSGEAGVRVSGIGAAARGAKHSCAICGRQLGKTEVKFVLPSRALSKSSMNLSERLACVECYAMMARKSRVRAPAVQRQSFIRRIAVGSSIAQSIVQGAK